MLHLRRPVSLLAAIAAVGLAALFGDGLPASAAPLAVIDGQALDVSAEHVDVDVEHGTALLTGNVAARLGDLEVRCPTIELAYDESPRVKWAHGKGGVVARFKGIEVTAPAADLDAKSRTVVLSGGVRLARGRGWMSAERATLDLASGKVSLQEVKGSIPVEPVRR
jgi:lipopolysaccharide export system protein LptA